MGDVLKSRTSADWLERLDANDVPCAPVLSRPEILENEQIKANKLISQYEHPGLGQIRQPRPGAKFSRSDMRKEPIAPALGQHSEEILRDLGLSGTEIKELVDKGIVMTSSGDKV
jgi:crotonobetainyl-CoA:carnitine CoA-transferase CaiB-like acyl-CoA transferase